MVSPTTTTLSRGSSRRCAVCAGGLRLRAQRAHAGEPALPVQTAVAFGAAPVRGTTGRRPASVRDPRRLQRRPHDEDVWNIADFEGSTHVSEPERVAIRELVELGLEDLPPTISKGQPVHLLGLPGGLPQGLGIAST